MGLIDWNETNSTLLNRQRCTTTPRMTSLPAFQIRPGTSPPSPLSLSLAPTVQKPRLELHCRTSPARNPLAHQTTGSAVTGRRAGGAVPSCTSSAVVAVEMSLPSRRGVCSFTQSPSPSLPPVSPPRGKPSPWSTTLPPLLAVAAAVRARRRRGVRPSVTRESGRHGGRG